MPRIDNNQTTQSSRTTTSVVTSSVPVSCRCIAKEVLFIDRLQKRAENRDNCLSCSGSNLGDNVLNNNIYNTRPIILYLPNGEMFRIRIGDFFSPTNEQSEQTINQVSSPSTSNIFRVEEVDGCCCRLRALKYCLGKYIATNFCCTADLEDFTAIQCLNDTYVANLNF